MLSADKMKTKAEIESKRESNRERGWRDILRFTMGDRRKSVKIVVPRWSQKGREVEKKL